MSNEEIMAEVHPDDRLKVAILGYLAGDLWLAKECVRIKREQDPGNAMFGSATQKHPDQVREEGK